MLNYAGELWRAEFINRSSLSRLLQSNTSLKPKKLKCRESRNKASVRKRGSTSVPVRPA